MYITDGDFHISSWVDFTAFYEQVKMEKIVPYQIFGPRTDVFKIFDNLFWFFEVLMAWGGLMVNLYT